MTMDARRAEQVVWVALAACIFIVTASAASLYREWRDDLAAAQTRVRDFARMVAENTGGRLDAVELLLRGVAADLSRSPDDWRRWPPEAGWAYFSRHAQGMPLVRSLDAYDEVGLRRFTSLSPSPKRAEVAATAWFADIAGGQRLRIFGPFVSSESARYSLGMARRMVDAGQHFTGVLTAAIDPFFLQDFCWPVRLADEAEVLLVGSDQRIAASCRPSDLSDQSRVIGAPLAERFLEGARHLPLHEAGEWQVEGTLVVVVPVPGLPDLRVVVGVPEGALLQGWQARVRHALLLSLVICLTLMGSALAARRQLLRTSRMASELAAHRDQLTTRIEVATAEATRQRDAAERANQAKSRFLAAASHDLRQPLHALALFSTDLHRKLRLGRHDELPRIAEQIASSTTLISELMDSLLDISRLDLDGISADIRPFPLQAVFDRLAGAFRRAALERGMTLRLRPTAAWVNSDPALLERALSNLLSNALRYSMPGKGRIVLAARRRGDSVRIEVRDNGCGIAPEHQQAIFAEFYQVSNTAREASQGLGLGLSIVERIVRALGIEMQLWSRPGEGACFALRVAAATPREGAAGLPAGNEAALPAVCLFGEAPPMPSVADLLRTWGYPVVIAGAEAPMPTGNALAVCDAASLDAACAVWTGTSRLVVLVPESGDAPPLPEGGHALRLPLRPAKLRALLGQLQKTSSKSMP